jgi:hypothetical protein
MQQVSIKRDARGRSPLKGLAEFHARFLPVPLSGTWFARL